MARYQTRQSTFLRDVQQDADSGEGEEEACAAGGDEGERDSLGGQQREHYADVEEGLKQDGGRESEGGEARKRIRGPEGGAQAAISEHGEEDEDEHGAEEAQFFGDVGVNKICVRLRGGRRASACPPCSRGP